MNLSCGDERQAEAAHLLGRFNVLGQYVGARRQSIDAELRDNRATEVRCWTQVQDQVA